MIVVETQAKLVPILIAVNRGPKCRQLRRIEIKTMDRVAVIRLADPVLIEFEMVGHKFPDGGNFVLSEHVFLLEALALHAVAGHRRGGILDCWELYHSGT